MMNNRLKTLGILSFWFELAYIFLITLAVIFQSIYRPARYDDIFVVPWDRVIPIIISALIQFIFLFLILSNHKKSVSSIVPEILVTVLKYGIYPMAMPWIYQLTTAARFATQETAYILNYGSVSNLLSFINFLSAIATAFFILFCGYSIACKTLNRKEEASNI